jgi:lipid-A-disaccharide synthase-like uncharacterized protein
MTTFKYWLIANFEIIIGVVTILVNIILWLCTYDEERPKEMSANLTGWMFFSLTAVVFYSSPTESCSVSLFKYIVLLLLSILILLIHIYIEKDDPSQIPLSIIVWGWFIFVAGTVIGIRYAIFTKRNIDQIVSRRMLYRNSSVQLFEITWKYTLDRFACIASSIIICLGTTVGSIYILIYYM